MSKEVKTKKEEEVIEVEAKVVEPDETTDTEVVEVKKENLLTRGKNGLVKFAKSKPGKVVIAFTAGATVLGLGGFLKNRFGGGSIGSLPDYDGEFDGDDHDFDGTDSEEEASEE